MQIGKQESNNNDEDKKENDDKSWQFESVYEGYDILIVCTCSY